jgi:hypothetical protein
LFAAAFDDLFRDGPAAPQAFFRALLSERRAALLYYGAMSLDTDMRAFLAARFLKRSCSRAFGVRRFSNVDRVTGPDVVTALRAVVRYPAVLLALEPAELAGFAQHAATSKR